MFLNFIILKSGQLQLKKFNIYLILYIYVCVCVSVYI